MSAINLTLFSKVARLRTGSAFVAAFLLGLGGYAIHETHAHATGITGQTQKTTSAGCYCHCASANSATTVTITTSATTFYTGQSYEFTATVSSSSEADGGIDIATEDGTFTAISGQGLYVSSGELTHSTAKTLPASWNFEYTAPALPTYDTIFATGNAVNGDGLNNGGTCIDKWNNASKFIIHVQTAPTKRIAFGRRSISLGSVRVEHRIADSLLVTSDGDAAITISSSVMKSGTHFSGYPTTTNRTLNPGSTELDSAIFTPTARGTFNDSLIFTTNSDTVAQQHISVAVSGQGIQGVFSAINGTSLSFGNLRVGGAVQHTFAFSN
ncbi:MAG: choice-of-anchor V domain-containing protein, partial [Candidatus Kapaibacterium sp.]